MQQRDPESAARIHPHDSQRIQRALEVLALSGKPLGEHWQQQQDDILFADWEIVTLEPEDRPELHARLARRLESMIRGGLAAEVHDLLLRPVFRLDPACVWSVTAVIEHVSERIPRNGRQNVRCNNAATCTRQMTWLRSRVAAMGQLASIDDL